MTLFFVLALVIVYVAAAVASIHDPKPQRRPREWTVGALMGDRH